ncbi:MAG: hypothetical protein IPN29_20220 [Saprospiraceae bacterium]|nr:hypothetical protein [Saprospiraceae bacterium]
MDFTQKALFQSIKNLYKKETFSLVDEISQVLHLERGATYKRISGETALKVEEVVTLCQHYNLSFDAILEETVGLNQVSFATEHISRTSANLQDFLMAFGRTFDSLRRGKNNELIILGNELPAPYFFNFPRLTAFMYHMWHYEEGGYQQTMRPLSELYISSDDKRLMGYLSHEFCNHPSTEIWGMRIFDATFNKLRLGVRIGFIESGLKKMILGDLLKMMNHLKRTAESGIKVDPESGREYNEVHLLINHYYQGGTLLYYNTDGYEKAFICNDYPDFIHTNDTRFTGRIREKIYSYKAFSASISRDNALERNLYFRHLQNEYEKLCRDVE